MIKTYLEKKPPEDIMMRLFPLTWAALHIGLATAATYLLVTTDLLTDAAVFLIH